MAKKKSASNEAATGGRLSWLDETQTPLIDDYTRQLDTFIQTMADGRVDKAEMQAQEKRLVKLLKEVEPVLDDALHARVTKLLCELTAYNIMQTLKTLQDARPRTIFRG
jgi:hypothetical protein